MFVESHHVAFKDIILDFTKKYNKGIAHFILWQLDESSTRGTRKPGNSLHYNGEQTIKFENNCRRYLSRLQRAFNALLNNAIIWLQIGINWEKLLITYYIQTVWRIVGTTASFYQIHVFICKCMQAYDIPTHVVAPQRRTLRPPPATVFGRHISRPPVPSFFLPILFAKLPITHYRQHKKPSTLLYRHKLPPTLSHIPVPRHQKHTSTN